MSHISARSPPKSFLRYSGISEIDFDMCFTFVSIGQPGFMQNTIMLYPAIIVDKEIFPHPPLGKSCSTILFLCPIQIMSLRLKFANVRKMLC